jgi:Ca-activated chloride channel family protein
MRAFLVALVVAPALANAQGSIILPRPCFPCPTDAVCRPCGQMGAQVVKQSSQVRALLSDRVLRYEVTETFVNRGARVGEADYVFPLPRGAAFQDLQLSINGEMVAGETLNASQARSIYEDIVRRQRDPALVEWMGYGMLRARIFPINPGEEKKVVVRYQMVAEREGDALRVDYFRGRQTQDDQWRVIPASRRDEPRSSFTLAYPANSTYGRAYSPTHSLTTNERDGRREVTVDGNGSEITVLIPVRKSTEPSLSMLAYAPRNEDGFALITLSPPMIATRTATARDVTLVLDVSGSMAGVKIQQARDAGKQVLTTLTSSDRFRLIDFSTDVRSFRDGFVRATPQNISDASRYLESLDASGSTNISGALDEALQGNVPSGRLSLVLFVTDGEPTVGERDPELIAQRAARERGDRRIFTFGVGADLNAALIERLALEGRGTAQFVRREESVERAVSIVASRLTNPVVTNVRIYADGVRLVKPYPSGPSDIFAGQDFVMLARYNGSGSGRIRVEGETPNGPVRWTSPVSFPETARENSFVARLWATQRVGYLSAEKRRSGGSAEIDDEIRRLGEKYAIPTEFTSYLVVEPGMRRAVNMSPSVIVNGVVNATAASAPAPSAQVFEAVRDAAKLRAATSLAAADEVSMQKSDAMQHVGARTFNLMNGVWTDAAVKKSTRVVKVRAFSKAYFSLVNEIPDLKDALALGDKVSIAGRDVVIEIADDGVETINDTELKRIVAAW